jgi:hypothetical protein
MMRMSLSNRPELLILGAAQLVLIATLYAFFMQHFSIPSSMRYVRPHNTAYIVSSPLRDVWTALTPHLQAYFNPLPGERTTPAQELARSLASDLTESGIVLRRIEDLAELGIDADGQSVLTLLDHNGSPHVLVALPVLDPTRFLKTLERYIGKPLMAHSRTGERSLFQTQSGDLVMGFGDDGAAVISDNAVLVQEVLAKQNENLAYFQSSDWHRRGMSAWISSDGLGLPPWLRGEVNVPAMAALVGADDAAALIGDLQFAVVANERSLELQLHALLPDGRAEAIARLLEPPPAERVGTVTAMLSRSQAVVSIRDRSLSYFLRYLPTDTTSGTILAGLLRLFPGLLNDLRGANTLSEISLAASDPTARVPRMVAGLRMAETEADVVVLKLQTSLRLKRDREILRLAADAYRSQASLDAATPVRVETLRRSGLLGVQNDALWPRYALASDHEVPEPALAARDFDNPSYNRYGGAGIVLRYLMPPVTEDDFAYRFSAKRDQIDEAELKRGGYRLCSVYIDGTLWLGNDAEVLADWLARLAAMPVSNYAASVNTREAPALAKANLLLLPRELLESSQLYPDDTVNESTRKLLADIQQYRSARLVIESHLPEREIHLLARLDRH